MKKWIFFLAVFSGVAACGEQDLSDDESPDLQAQVTAADSGIKMVPSADGGGPTLSGAIGSACVANTDCKTPGATCLKEIALPFGAVSLPGGLCTKSCKADRDCGTGSACPLAGAEAFLPGISQCLMPCKAASDCREGYRCAATSIGSIPGLGAAVPATPATHCLPPMPGGGAPAGGFPAGGFPFPGAAPAAPKK